VLCDPGRRSAISGFPLGPDGSTIHRETGKKSEGKSPPNAAVVSLKRSDVRWSRWKKERTPACKGDDEFN
jgi:hypothetical protein